MQATTPRDKIVHYLSEAHSDELALAATLRSHVAVAAPGPYRTGLEGYLRETREHARRVSRRLAELGASEGRVRAGLRAARAGGGSIAAGARRLLAAVRPASAEEKRLTSAKYGCATEGLVIATYAALELVAKGAGDHATAELAADIRGDEERMLTWLRHEILKLTDTFIRSELDEYDELDVQDVRRALSESEGPA